MSKQSLLKAVELAGGQTQLGRAIRERIPGSKIGQVTVWGWLNDVKIEVPPAEVVLAIAEALDYRITPHELRTDLYPNEFDAMPADVIARLHAGRQDAGDRRVTPDRRQHEKAA